MLNKLKMAISKLKNPSETKHSKPLIILDIGCRWGFADKFLNDMNNIKVYGFDPDTEECKRLESLYHNKNIHLVPVGLADKPGKRVLHVTSEAACSSLYKPDKNLTTNYPALDCAREISQIPITVSTLDIWSKETGIDYADYIKIDTQGAELCILEGAINLLPSVRFLEVEVEFNPIYEGQPIFSDVDSFLRKHGFVLWKFSNIVHYSKNDESEIILSNNSIHYDHHELEHQTRGGQLYWADAFYARKEIVDAAYNENETAQLKRDSDIAGRLGFLDLKYRLEKEHNKITGVK